MWTHQQHPSAALLGCLGTAILLAACSGDLPSGASGDPMVPAQASGGRIAVCHRSGPAGAIIEVSRSELAAHLSHGDYVTTLAVATNGPPDDGEHFRRIGDALAAARAGRLARGELLSADCRITIAIVAGIFRGTALHAATDGLEHFPLVVDVPDITLHGALVLQLDAGGRPTGAGVGPLATTLSPIEPLPTPLIIANGHPGGSAGNGLTIEGFVLQSGQKKGAGGQAVFGMRVSGLTIRGNRIEEKFSESIDLRAASAVVEENHLGGGGGTCDICLAGPGVYRVSSNRLLAGGIPGIITVPATGLDTPFDVEQYDLPAAAEVTAEIRNNEVRDHRFVPVGVGIRVAGIGPFASDVHGSSHVTIRDNLLVNNRFALMIEAAFPEPETELRSDIDVTLGGNVMQQSCQADLLVSFARHTTGLGIFEGAYLRSSTYRVTLGGDLSWSDVWFSHPDGFGNTLVVDGQTIPNGTRQFHDPDTCPGTAAALAG